MEEFADDEVCQQAIAENKVVMARTRERVDLLKAEVEGRGLRWTGQFWDPDEIDGQGDAKVNGVARPGEESRPEEGTGDAGGDDGVHL